MYMNLKDGYINEQMEVLSWETEKEPTKVSKFLKTVFEMKNSL